MQLCGIVQLVSAVLVIDMAHLAHIVLADGVTNYQVKVKETPEEEAARLEAFARELESKRSAAAAAAQPATTTAAAEQSPSAAQEQAHMHAVDTEMQEQDTTQ